MTVLSTLQNCIETCWASFTELIGDSNSEFLIENKWSLAAGAIVAYAVYKYLTKPKNLPPGPRGVPVLGALLSLSENIYLDVQRFAQKYKSDIVSYYIGSQLIVMLNSADAVKQCFVKSEEFDYRDQSIKDDFDLHEQFFTPQYSENWSKLKSTALSSLKTHGFGTSRSEDNMKEQVYKMMVALHNLENNTVDFADLFNIIAKAKACVIMKIIVNHIYEFDDPEVDNLIEKVQKFEAVFYENVFMIFFGNSILPSFIMWFLKRPYINKTTAAAKHLRDIFYRFLEEHKASLDVNNSRDFMDDLLIRNETSGHKMTDLEIVDSCLIFSPDSIDNAANQTTWVLFYICWYPEVQEEMVKEIKKVCGGSPPSTKDRNNMVYCDAVILETSRMSSISALTGAHMNKADTTVKGYFIPKGTSVIANLYAVHYDEKVFPKPHQFKPSRFISNRKLANFENVLPFGAGRRKCVGEVLMKTQIFLYVTSIVQKFELSFVEKPASMVTDNVYRRCPKHKMKFVPRN